MCYVISIVAPFEVGQNAAVITIQSLVGYVGIKPEHALESVFFRSNSDDKKVTIQARHGGFSAQETDYLF